MISPFHTHRNKVLGHYSTAAWLRQVVMALWRGDENPVGLSKLCTIDNDHFTAFSEMVAQYRREGENDLALIQLVKDIEARRLAEEEAREKAELYEDWSKDCRRELRRLGKSADLLDDRYNWFEARFSEGLTPQAAAEQAQPLPSLNP